METQVQSNPQLMSKFLFDQSCVRGEHVELDQDWQSMIQYHHYPKCVTRMLGEFTAGTLLLAATIKFNGSVTLQVRGDGPVSMLVVEVQNNLAVRAMAKVNPNIELSDDMDMTQLINANGKGQCVITLNSFDKVTGQLYQGVVALNSSSVATVLENYMLQSEQLHTRFWLASSAEKIAGMLIQKMPDIGGNSENNTDSDAWNRIVQLTDTITTDELLSLQGSEILQRLYWQEKLQLLACDSVVFQCHCSRSRTDDLLRSLGQKELQEHLEKDHRIDITCQFCNRVQTYDEEDVKNLFINENQQTEEKTIQ